MDAGLVRRKFPRQVSMHLELRGEEELMMKQCVDSLVVGTTQLESGGIPPHEESMEKVSAYPTSEAQPYGNIILFLVMRVV